MRKDYFVCAGTVVKTFQLGLSTWFRQRGEVANFLYCAPKYVDAAIVFPGSEPVASVCCLDIILTQGSIRLREKTNCVLSIVMSVVMSIMMH